MGCTHGCSRPLPAAKEIGCSSACRRHCDPCIAVGASTAALHCRLQT
jgi:hypothetical protein